MADTQVMTGNAANDGDAYRGWFIGGFVPREYGLASTTDVEVKWGAHALGDVRSDWGASEVATTLSVLVRGSIRLVFGDGREALLAEPGDYAVWAPGVRHRWSIERADTVVLTVRWPSRP